MRGRLLAFIGGLTSAVPLTTVAAVGQTPPQSSKSVYTPPSHQWSIRISRGCGPAPR